jgi:pimeloyl-ACP methyl ester carboxylesterase
MKIAQVNGVELEYDEVGSGEPVLLISSVLADGLVPLLAEPALIDRYRLIRYHKRGWCGSTHTTSPVGVATHAGDAAALLDHLGIGRAHIAGHSSGAAVAAQLALDEPDRIATLMLLEMSPLSMPSGLALVQSAAPVLEAFGAGDHEGAVAGFLSAASGLDWPTCRAVLDARVPGAVTDAVKDAETFFGVEIPALVEWTFGLSEAAAIRAPVLSMLGARTEPFWVDVAAFLRSSIDDVEERTIEDAGHLLHIEQPEAVARAIAEFLDRHPIDRRAVR